MMDNRISIPNEIKRKLRIEGGFGCCMCGFPFIEYHHIIPYFQVQSHNDANMMIVCSRCHDLITAGVIPENEQRQHKQQPYNLKQENISGEIFLRRNTVLIGGTSFRCNGPLIVMDNEIIIFARHDDLGNLLLSLSLYDEDNTLLAQLVDNEWVVRPDMTWDLEFTPKSILIRQAARKISLDIKLINAKVQIFGSFWKNGYLFKVGSDALTTGSPGNNLGIMEFLNCYIDVNTQKQTRSIVLGNGLHPFQPY